MHSKSLEKVVFTAYGHPNVSGIHKSTLEVTMESDLASKGDCIIGVRGTQSALTIREKIGDYLRTPACQVVTRFSAGDHNDKVRGFGSPELVLSSHNSLVWRTSTHIDPRTIAIRCDKAARDLDRGLIQYLQDSKSILQVVIEVSVPAISKSRTT